MDTKVLNYRIIIEPEKYKDGGVVYVAHCPTLGISDYGDTVEEVLISIKEGIQLAVECLAKKNQEVPVDSLEDQIITSAKISPPANLHFSLAA
ncbi:MAG: type II toxin-antitoxin system HicB family antitoxin [Candidatus Beckwithbacteria bacterium]|nr:type II toxin-antitoxin system HicB family antitoxin [Candidatus Beckwithbacteria bacterium]